MTITRIDAKTLKHWLDKQEAAVVDVREPAEYAAAHIEGSTLHPLGQIENLNVAQFSGKKMVVHCLSGRRSDTACHKLATLYPDLDMFDLEGGISAWMDGGYPTQTA